MLTGSDAAMAARVAALETIVDVLLRERSDRAVAAADETLPVGIARRIRGIDLLDGVNGVGFLTLIVRDGQGIRRDYLLSRDELAEFLRAHAEMLPAARADLDPDTAHVTALARKANAEAELMELQAAAERCPPPDDGRNPVHVDSGNYEADAGAGIVRCALKDREGRIYRLAQTPYSARESARILLEMAELAERREER